MFNNRPGITVDDSIGKALAGRLIEYAEDRLKQEGYSVGEGSAVKVLKHGAADPRYEVEWTDLRAGQQVAVVCIYTHNERSFMDMGIRKNQFGQRMMH